MDYYTGPFGRSATFTLRDRSGRTIARVVGQLRGLEPSSVESDPAKGPLSDHVYEVITVDRITEVIEHREAGPTFYVTDDPHVKQKLRVR